MEKVLEYLKSAGVFYVATCEENGQPRVRPFGALCGFEGKIYLVTANQKDVYKQMMANPKIEISAMYNNTWIRIAGEVKEDTRREARVAMMEANKKALSSMYSVDDNVMTVLYFTHGTATICSFTDQPEVIEF